MWVLRDQPYPENRLGAWGLPKRIASRFQSAAPAGAFRLCVCLFFSGTVSFSFEYFQCSRSLSLSLLQGKLSERMSLLLLKFQLTDRMPSVL